MNAMKPVDPQAVVIFGASGDLTKRKLLPAFWHLFVEGLLPAGFALVGYARSAMTDGEFTAAARAALKAFAKVQPSGEEWEDFAKLLWYIPGEFECQLAMEQLREHLERLDRAS